MKPAGRSRTRIPEVNVLMLTSYSEEEAVTAAIMAGASAYLLKNVGRSELIKAIRGVAAGQNQLDPAVTRQVMEKLVQLSAREEAREVAELSQREREVMALIAEGATNRGIAERLVITENTARNHVSRILDKLGLSRRSEAAVFAAQHGLVKKNSARGVLMTAFCTDHQPSATRKAS